MIRISTFIFIFSCSGVSPYQETAEIKYKGCYNNKKDQVDNLVQICMDDGGSPKSCLAGALKWICGN